MSTEEDAKKKQYFKYGLWMLIAGIVFWVVGGFVLRIQLTGFVGFILFGAGIIVILTNRTK